jgi:hypothetical protein
MKARTSQIPNPLYAKKKVRMIGSYDKENLSESKFFYDSKIEFEVEARARKLFGRWAAAKLGLDAEEAEKYALEVLNTNIQVAGFGDIISKVASDLSYKKINLSRHLIEMEMEKALSFACAKGELPALLD